MEETETILRKGHKNQAQSTAKRIIVPLTVLLVVVLGICLITFLCVAVAALVIGLVLSSLFPVEDQLLYWDWNKINTTDLHFPNNFWFGTATAAHQVEGNCDNNQWYAFENRTPSPIRNGDKSGLASNHYNRYPSDIQLMKNVLGVNMYRFSIEWSKIEPSNGVWNMSVVEHYHNVIDTLLANGIQPMVTLHHFTDPIWFSNLGAFENQSNIEYFIRFSKFVYSQYSNKVQHWCTFNEPNVYTLIGYYQGLFPPGKQDPILAAMVMRNLGIAHIEVYQELKKLNSTPQIGIVINFVQYDPVNPGDVLDRFIAKSVEGTYFSLFNFFRTGQFEFYVPNVVDLKYFDSTATQSNDYIGVNYYFHNFVKFDPSSLFVFVNNSVLDPYYTDMGWPIYPEGIYRAIRRASQLKVPIYITENGIADAVDDRRELFIKRYMYAVSKAIKDGYDVKSYIYWSFVDNFEWASGFYPRFGLFHNDYATQTRTLYGGSQAFVDVVRRFRG